MRAGAFELANRVVMAPLTRNRAGAGLVPGRFALEYYVQRATAGLIIAEATQISA
ncbi:N-ethylmaleimide reductase [Caballeronia sordidicola]|uniref:N-ethylmaleimide reductase n=1 Tax=Caballeronia sordidicola TaxID=196367 RepID=A0A242MLE7_CABSO|nr:N-ethylmaleimide reductase [Caballeronia sordidicola]